MTKSEITDNELLQLAQVHNVDNLLQLMFDRIRPIASYELRYERSLSFEAVVDGKRKVLLAVWPGESVKAQGIATVLHLGNLSKYIGCTVDVLHDRVGYPVEKAATGQPYETWMLDEVKLSTLISLLESADKLGHATFLLVWNPLKFQWHGFDNDLDLIKQEGHVEWNWSCGVTKRIQPGDRVFMMKLGRPEPHGLIASGEVISEVYADEHWVDESGESHKLSNYIRVRFDTLLNPAEKIFDAERLKQGVYADISWFPQASGRSIPSYIAMQLERDWASYIEQPIFQIETALPEEAETNIALYEGSVKQITVNSFERSAKGRAVCLHHCGVKCSVCGFDFEEVYDEIGKGYIHVHHLKPLSQIKDTYELDPINDLRPVCPNCHAMLHRQTPALSIEELQAIIHRSAV